MLKEEKPDFKFETFIDAIIREINDHEELHEEIPTDENIKEVINTLLQEDKYKEYQGRINTIYQKISEKSKYKLKVAIETHNIITFSIYSKFLIAELNKIFNDFLPDLLYSKSQNACINNNHEFINITYIFRRAFKFFKAKLNEGRCDGVVNGNLKIKDVQQATRHEVSVDLEAPPEYKLIPDSVKFKLRETEVNIFSKENLKLNDVDIFDEIIIEDNSSIPIEEDLIIETRFLNFLSYFANLILIEKEIICDMKKGLPLYHIKIDQLRFCAKKLESDNCMKKIYEKLNHEFLPFADSSIDRPKGIIFYGPPRTGKTFTTSKIIDYLKLFLIYPNLAASDFSHGLQGQSEKMVDNIAKRTEVIPWQLCVLFIDEIDSLAPSRSSSNTNNSQASLIGQFLSVIDGSKKKPNMLIIGTTNRLETMDAAFVQRMDIKIFLGVPNCEVRKSWILRKIEDYLKTKKNDELFILYYEEFISIISEWVNMTMNFTADAMKKSLDQYFSEFYYNDEMRNMFEHLYKLPKDQIVDSVADELEKHCMRDNLKLGKYILPKMIQEIPSDFGRDPEYSELKDFINLIYNSQPNDTSLKSNTNYHLKYSLKPTRRILIDLDIANIECQIQVETKESFILNKDAMNIVKSMSKKSDFEFFTQDFKYAPNSDDRNKFVKLFNNINKKFGGNNSNLDEEDQFKKIKENFMNNFESTKVINFHKFGGFQNRTEVLKVLIKMGVEINVDSVLLLDFEYFASRNILDENKMAEELSQSLIEAEKYDKSIIIFDLDNLLEVAKNYSNQNKDLIFSNSIAFELDKNEVSFTENIIRPSLMRIIFNYAETFLEKNSNHWVIFISGKTKILMELKERLKWPLTYQENKNIEKAEKLLEEKVCIRCKEVFTEKDNAVGKCMQHISKKLYMETELNFKLNIFQKNNETNKITTFSTTEYNKILESLTTYDFLSVGNLIEEGKASAADFKWFCCKKGLYEKGEIPCLHESD
jgi:hypothetical protein